MKHRSQDLSKREKQFASLLLEGKTNKQIALVLGINEVPRSGRIGPGYCPN